MARKKQPIYPPLDFLKKTTAQFPGVWDTIEQFRRGNGVMGQISWEAWCYVPMAFSLAVARDAAGVVGDPRHMPIDQMRGVASAAASFSALAPWRQSKEVYVMDEGMQELLFDQAGDLSLSADILLRLPYPCFYIQFSPAVDYAGDLYHGVFVFLNDDFFDGRRQLYLLYLQQDGETSMLVPVPLEAKTISESMDIVERDAVRKISEGQDAMAQELRAESAHTAQQFDLLRRTMQLILYICAQNAEITPSPEQASRTKRSSTGVIVDRYAEIRKWDVGIRVGNAVRNYRRQQETTPVDDPVRTHASPRPHMRRGHWHHFWTGPKNKPAERKLILQWVAPTFVTASSKNDTPVVLHRVDMPDTDDQPSKA